MRILILSLYYAPEITSNASVITELTQQLGRDGQKLTVIAGTPHYRLPSTPNQYKNKLFVRERLGSVDVVRVYAVPKSNTMLYKFLNYCSYFINSLIAALLVEKHDIVMAVSPPFFLAASAWIIAKIRGSKLIYNAQDLFPDSYISSGAIKSGFIAGWIEKFHNWALNKCSAITVITPSFKRRMVSASIAPERIRVIPNFAVTDKITPQPKLNAFSIERGLSEKFVVLYAGNLGLTHGPDILVDVARKLNHLQTLKILIVGDGLGRKPLVDKLTIADQNVILLPPQSVDILPNLLGTADIGIVTTKKNVAKASFPSRIYNLMAAARPIVACVDLDSDAAALIRIAGCGICVLPEDAEGLSHAIEMLYSDPERRAAMGWNGRAYLCSHYDVRQVSMQYATLFHELAGLV